MSSRPVIPVALACLATIGASVSADWPQWRGPARNGTVAPTVREPAAWPAGLRVAWRQQVGLGHSSPVVAGTRVFLHSRQGEQEVVAAYELASGKALWQQRYSAPYTVNPAAASHGKGPKSTPVVADGTICTFGISGILSCFDAARGMLKWRHDFTREFEERTPIYGTAMSPVVDRGLLIAHIGGPGKGALTAFDLATGAARWRWSGDGPAYASPVAVTIGGTRQVVTQSERHLVGVSATDGTLLWSVPFTTSYDQNAVTPVVHDDVVIYSGLGNGLNAVRVIPARGGRWRTETTWTNETLPTYMSTPVLVGGVLYGLTHRNRGQIFAADPATGRALWTTGGRQAENAALVAIGGSILALTTEGTLLVFRQSRTAYEEVRRYDVADSPTWAHPAVTASGILVKDESTLSLWKVP